jgi:hypothetical protein
MRPNGVYIASINSDSYSTGIGIIEIQAAASSIIEILRAWVGPAEGAAPVDEVQEVAVYRSDTVGTGTAMTEQAIQGGGDGASGATAISAVTRGGTPEELLYDAYHVQNGWLYLPVPEERFRIVSGGEDNIGIWFPVAPDAAMTISAGIIWAEYS